MRVVLTIGGTEEPLDDVRVLTNLSSGRFGAALARAALARGADVVVLGSHRALADPTALPPGVQRHAFRSHQDLDALLDEVTAQPVDALLMAAAVADYAPRAEEGKLPSSADKLVLRLHRTPKLLATLRARCGPDTRLVGFKLLSGVTREELETVARAQLEDRELDLVVANDLAELGGATHPVLLVGRGGTRRVEGLRDEVADAVVDAVMQVPVPDGPWPTVLGPRRARGRVWWQVAQALGPVTAEAEDPAALLACLRTPPWRPVALPTPAGRVVGLGELDAVRMVEAWQALAHALGPAAVPLLHEGTLVAGARRVAGGWEVHDTGLMPATAWALEVLPVLEGTLHLPPSLAAALAPLGLRALGDAGALVEVLPPWADPQRAAAASACLVDLARGLVLVGERRVAPAGGLAFPGGRAEPGEEPEATARRELREETGMDAPPGAPWWRTTTWQGGATAWEITCCTWLACAGADPPATAELVAAWRPLAAVRDDPRTLPGVRVVLDRLQRRVDTI
ncbi:MAG: NUDIX domain-containing protein [Alphaproteobacteria bacterium]|nr:NUDIX domain-containing protein [Alphaproteobacteria bacterium]